MPHFIRVAAAVLAFLTATSACAAFVSFDLTRSDELRDGTHYLRVTIDDQGVPGRINFHVSVLEPLLAFAGRHFGIDEFAFNSAFAIPASNFVGLPKNWKATGADKVGDFGYFDESIEAKSTSARLTSLSFSLTGIKWDTISSYLEPSSGRAREGNYFFAAHVAGLDGHFNCITDANFGGGIGGPPLPTPLPAAAWLMAAGLFLLLPVIRRRPGPVARPLAERHE